MCEQREGQRETESSSRLRAGVEPSSGPDLMTETKSQTLNRLSHPGTPSLLIFNPIAKYTDKSEPSKRKRIVKVRMETSEIEKQTHNREY